jgi:hypothetical protein
VIGGSKERLMAPSPSTLTVHRVTEPDRLAASLLQRAYALVVPTVARAVAVGREPPRHATSDERRGEQAR